MSVEIRTLRPEEYAALAGQIQRAFGYDALEGDRDRLLELVAPERSSCAFDDGRLVGTCAGFDLQLTTNALRVKLCGSAQRRSTWSSLGVGSRLAFPEDWGVVAQRCDDGAVPAVSAGIGVVPRVVGT